MIGPAWTFVAQLSIATTPASSSLSTLPAPLNSGASLTGKTSKVTVLDAIRGLANGTPLGAYAPVR